MLSIKVIHKKIFCPTKRGRTNCPIPCTMVNLVDMGQCKDKNDHYHSFKVQLKDRPKAIPRSQVGLTIDLDQCIDKNSYYHSFKTRLNNRLGSQAG